MLTDRPIYLLDTLSILKTILQIGEEKMDCIVEGLGNCLAFWNKRKVRVQSYTVLQIGSQDKLPKCER